MKRCGVSLFDDFEELKPGAAADLARSLNHTPFDYWIDRPDNYPRSYRPHQTNTQQETNQRTQQRGISGLGSWFRSSNPGLPTHTRSSTGSNRTYPMGLHNPHRLFLLNCIGYGKYTVKLSQQQLDNVATDRQLFDLMRAVYLSKGFWERFLSFKTVVSLNFVKVS